MPTREDAMDLGTVPLEHAYEGTPPSYSQVASETVPGAESRKQGHTGETYTYGQKRKQVTELSGQQLAERDLKDFPHTDDEDESMLNDDDDMMPSMMMGDDDDLDEQTEGGSMGTKAHGSSPHGGGPIYGGAGHADDDNCDDDGGDPFAEVQAALEAAGHKGAGGQSVSSFEGGSTHDDEGDFEVNVSSPPGDDLATMLQALSASSSRAYTKKVMSQPKPMDPAVKANPAGTSSGKISDPGVEGQAGS